MTSSARKWASAILLFAFGGLTVLAAESKLQMRVLFLGDNGHNHPEDRFKQLQPVLAERGINWITPRRWTI